MNAPALVMTEEQSDLVAAKATVAAVEERLADAEASAARAEQNLEASAAELAEAERKLENAEREVYQARVLLPEHAERLAFQRAALMRARQRHTDTEEHARQRAAAVEAARSALERATREHRIAELRIEFAGAKATLELDAQALGVWINGLQDTGATFLEHLRAASDLGGELSKLGASADRVEPDELLSGVTCRKPPPPMWGGPGTSRLDVLRELLNSIEESREKS